MYPSFLQKITYVPWSGMALLFSSRLVYAPGCVGTVRREINNDSTMQQVDTDNKQSQFLKYSSIGNSQNCTMCWTHAKGWLHVITMATVLMELAG